MWTLIVDAINNSKELNSSNVLASLDSKIEPQLSAQNPTLALPGHHPFSIDSKKLISSTEFNSCYAIADQHRTFFVKLNDKSHIKHFDCEAKNLQTINNADLFYTPDIIATGTTLDKSFIVLSHLHFEKAENRHWYNFGVTLANMHKQTQHGQFGWQTDNYIGETLQPNGWQSNWRTFFAEQRIGWQLQLLQEKSIKLGNIDHITALCHDALLHHQVTPCLLHGDLWQGNVGFVNEQATIFDPACYYGDREVDIAMTELFGEFPLAFYRGYNEYFPLPTNYEQRKVIYNFYHVLNHANMFGGVYINQAKAMLRRIMSMTLH